MLEQPAGPVDPRAALATRTRELLRGESLLIRRREVDRVVEAVLDDALGAGPLEPLMRDPAVTEVIVERARPRVLRARRSASA